MLKIKNLTVESEGKKILKDISLDFSVKPGNFFALFGPNGCGKSTLFKAIMGFENYKVKGDILLNEEKINGLTIDQRVERGLAYMYQSPPKIKGVKMEDILEEIPYTANIKKDIDDLSVEKFLQREINTSLSGGEAKRSELFTLSILPNTKVFLFDEPDSGVDLDNMKKIGKYMKKLLKKTKGIGIIITHTGDLLKYIDTEKGAVIYDGKLACQGDPEKILKCIRMDGYRSCVNCDIKKL